MNPDRAQLAALAALDAENWRALTREWLGPELLGPSVGEMGALFVAVEEEEPMEPPHRLASGVVRK